MRRLLSRLLLGTREARLYPVSAYCETPDEPCTVQGIYGGMGATGMPGFAPYSPYATMMLQQQMQQQLQLGGGGAMGAPYGVYGGPAGAASPYDGSPYGAVAGRGAAARASPGAAAGYGYSMRPSQYPGGFMDAGDPQGAGQGFDPQQQYAAYQQTQPPAPGQRNPEPWPPRDYRS